MAGTQTLLEQTQSPPATPVKPVMFSPWGPFALPALVEIAARLEKEDPLSVKPAIEAIAKDDKRPRCDRSEAMGYLIELQRRGLIDSAKLINFFTELISSVPIADPRGVRRDAMYAIAEIREFGKSYPSGCQ
jgi:hypothetical protein